MECMAWAPASLSPSGSGAFSALMGMSFMFDMSWPSAALPDMSIPGIDCWPPAGAWFGAAL
jgi:hypothetical protein